MWASGKNPREFCARFRLADNTTFARLRYGEMLAKKLGLFWRQKNQYYYDVWLCNGAGGYRFTQSDHDGAPGEEDVLQGLPFSSGPPFSSEASGARCFEAGLAFLANS